MRRIFSMSLIVGTMLLANAGPAWSQSAGHFKPVFLPFPATIDPNSTEPDYHDDINQQLRQQQEQLQQQRREQQDRQEQEHQRIQRIQQEQFQQRLREQKEQQELKTQQERQEYERAQRLQQEQEQQLREQKERQELKTQREQKARQEYERAQRQQQEQQRSPASSGDAQHGATLSMSHCITLFHSTEIGVGMELSNTCNQKLNIRYCVDNPNSSFACSKHSIGAKTLSPGSKQLIPDYSHDGAGQVYWAACVYPESASDWTGQVASQYSCR